MSMGGFHQPDVSPCSLLVVKKSSAHKVFSVQRPLLQCLEALSHFSPLSAKTKITWTIVLITWTMTERWGWISIMNLVGVLKVSTLC